MTETLYRRVELGDGHKYYEPVDVAKKVAEMSSTVDNDPAIPAGDTQWRKGYKQACSDIIAMLTTPVTNGDRK
jgi:hypothetical protein